MRLHACSILFIHSHRSFCLAEFFGSAHFYCGTTNRVGFSLGACLFLYSDVSIWKLLFFYWKQNSILQLHWIGTVRFRAISFLFNSLFLLKLLLDPFCLYCVELLIFWLPFYLLCSVFVATKFLDISRNIRWTVKVFRIFFPFLSLFFVSLFETNVFQVLDLIQWYMEGINVNSSDRVAMFGA